MGLPSWALSGSKVTISSQWQHSMLARAVARSELCALICPASPCPLIPACRDALLSMWLLVSLSAAAEAVTSMHICLQAMEPFFSVLLSALFLGDKPSPAVILSLVPIVTGVALASASEVTFNWVGFGSAMGSNLTFQSRNVLSKKVMGGNKVGTHSMRRVSSRGALPAAGQQVCTESVCL